MTDYVVPQIVGAKPALHKEVPMQTRVRVRGHQGLVGTVEGVASAGVSFHYIIRLDEETFLEGIGLLVRSIAVPGTELESPDGTTHWRNDP
jgi:hypothetical protein